MGEIIRINQNTEGSNLIQVTEELLLDVRSDIDNKRVKSVPIAEIATLGAAVAELVPSLNTITQTVEVNVSGLYKLANMGVGDTLKYAKNGNPWGVFKTPEGKSKLLQLQSADPMSITTEAIRSIDPATMMMAVALFSIEQQLGNIAEMERQILSFLELEKESEIEADIETLMSLIKNYKLNWDNEHFVSSNHKLVLDIQRTARKNMNLYQKRVIELLGSKQNIVVQSKLEATRKEMEKKFKFYRLSLYSFSLASFLEIMLGGNFKEEYILRVKDEIQKMSVSYREIFGQCSLYLEALCHLSVEANVLKGIGNAGNAVGKLIGSIPVIKNGMVDELLQDGGTKMKESTVDKEKKTLRDFAHISNPEISIFIEKMDDMIQIYNHTSEIYFDKEKIYLVSRL